MLQYLQSWFPGWGGWYGQQSPEGKPVEGLMAEPQEQWTPEEILGKAGAGFRVPFLITVKGDTWFMVHLLFVKLAHGIFQIKKKKVDICNSLSHVYRGRERFLKKIIFFIYIWLC